jgi:hypothetical protein
LTLLWPMLNPSASGATRHQLGSIGGGRASLGGCEHRQRAEPGSGLRRVIDLADRAFIDVADEGGIEETRLGGAGRGRWSAEPRSTSEARVLVVSWQGRCP